MVQTHPPGWDEGNFKLFFIGDDGMDVHESIYNRLKKDGINNILHLRDKHESNWTTIQKRINDDSAITEHFGDHSYNRLCVASNAVRYFIAIGRDIDPSWFKWTPMLENFKDGWNAIKELKKMDKPPVPRLNAKSYTPIKWAPAFKSVLRCYFGVNSDVPTPLSYLLRDDATRAPHGDVDEDFGWDKTYESYVDELEAKASHRTAQYRQDNELLWVKLEEAASGTPYASTVAAHESPRKDGRKAFLAIVKQYLGDDKWILEVRKHEATMRELKWKGTGNMTLEKFFSLHRQAYQGLVEASNHVSVELPSEETRVRYVIENIQSNDMDLKAAISTVKQDKQGKRKDFEAAAAAIQESCPIASKSANAKRQAAEISSVHFNEEVEIAATEGTVPLKKGIGKTGVHFRYYSREAYKKLKPAMKKELNAWRETPEGKAETERSKAEASAKKKAQQQSQKAKQKAQVSALVDEALQAKISAVLGQGNMPSPAPAPAPPPAPAVITPAMMQQMLTQMAQQQQQVNASAVQGAPPPPQPPNNWPLLPGILKKAKNSGSGSAESGQR